MQFTHSLSRCARTLGVFLALSVAFAGRALPQMAPHFTASLAASLLRSPIPSLVGKVGAVHPSAAASAAYPRESYAGRDMAGVPRYLQRAFTQEERDLLREQFGVEEPSRLYLSDTLPGASLTYDSDWDRGERDLVGSYRVGAPSVRQPGETWEELERRLATTDPAGFPRSTHHADASLASLDSVVRPAVRQMLAAARRAGFRVRITEARRSAERQAYLLTLDGRLTHTATSRHAEGFAVDVAVDDGNLSNAITRRHWIAFRRWLVARYSGTFRLIGAPDRSWDWPHIEHVQGPAGFHSIEELLAMARWCRDAGVADCTESWQERHAEAGRDHRAERRRLASPSGGFDTSRMTLPEAERHLSLAVEAVVARFGSMVRQVGRRYQLDEADLDEVMQEVRIRLWRSQGTSEQIGEVSTSYVYRTASSAALDVIRRRRSRKADRHQSVDDDNTAVALAESSPDPHRQLESSEIAQQVARAIESIPASRRPAVRMYLTGYPREEIAELMGWTEGKTRNLLYRGLADLREKLSEMGVGWERAEEAT